MPERVGRQPMRSRESQQASRRWWNAYQAEHGGFLGDADFVWCPEGLREADAGLLGEVAGRRILEVGCGAGACSRWLASQGARPVALDLSSAMLAHARQAAERSHLRHRQAVPVAVRPADCTIATAPSRTPRAAPCRASPWPPALHGKDGSHPGHLTGQLRGTGGHAEHL